MGQLLKVSRILVVDDNSDAADMVAALLETRGYTVATAYSGSDALAIAAAFKPDVIFLDINMPEMDGYQAAAALKTRFPIVTPRIVALTALNDDASRARMFEVGFDAHLTKPASLDAIVRSLA